MCARLPADGPSDGASRTSAQGVPARLDQERGRRAPADEHAPLRPGAVARARRSGAASAGRRRRARRARRRGPRAGGPPRARPARRRGRRGPSRARRAARSAPAAWPAASTPHQRAQGSAASARLEGRRRRRPGGRARAGRPPGRWRRGASSPSADDAASSATWRQRLSAPRAGAGPAATMKGSVTGSTVADGRTGSRCYARRDEPARAASPACTCASTPRTRWTGTRGATRPWPAPAPRTARCSCRSATRRATGAT